MSTTIEKATQAFDIEAAFACLYEKFGDRYFAEINVPRSKLWAIAERVEALVAGGHITTKWVDIILGRRAIKDVGDLNEFIRVFNNAHNRGMWWSLSDRLVCQWIEDFEDVELLVETIELQKNDLEFAN